MCYNTILLILGDNDECDSINKPPEPEKFCSFCKSPEYVVKKLFSNNLEGADLKFICDKCVVKCKELCTNEEN